MAVPAVFYLAIASQALPIAVTLKVWGRRPPAPYARVCIWCMVLLLSDAFDAFAARETGTNTWTSWITQPMDLGLTLWILSSWQPNAFLRLAYSMAIPITGTLFASLLLLTDAHTSFDQWIGPLVALFALTAVLHTLVHRTLLSRGLLTDQEWFWVCLGLALFWLGFGPIPPFANAVIFQHVEWVRWAYIGRATLILIAFLVISWGIVCQRAPAALPGRS